MNINILIEKVKSHKNKLTIITEKNCYVKLQLLNLQNYK